MSQTDQFLVAGATLECPCSTKTCKLLPSGDCGAMMIGDKLFLSVNAAKKKQNVAGFGMCTSKYCKGTPQLCEAKMRLAEKWINPVTANKVLTVYGGEEAIHKEARLLCLFGRVYVRALTTGQDELTESEKQFYKNMREIFGFDDDVIAIMLKVIHAIDEAYPKETERQKAWRFARLMGGFSYGYGADNRFIEIRNEIKETTDSVNTFSKVKDIISWAFTAGLYSTSYLNLLFDANEAGDDEKKYFVEVLKLSEDEYYKLKFNVMVQHEITSKPATSYPVYICSGVGTNIHAYNEVWKDQYNKIDSTEGAFEKEWERLYRKYLNISDENYEKMLEDPTIFADYSQIEKAAEKYAIEPKYSDFSHQQILTATILLDENKTVDSMAGGCMENLLDSTVGLEILGDIAGDTIKNFVSDYRVNHAGWLGDIRLADSNMSEDDYKADLDGVNVSGLIINEGMNTIEAVNEYYEAIEKEQVTREKAFLLNMGDGDVQKGLENVINADMAESVKQNISGYINGFISGDEFDGVIGDQISKEFMAKILAGLE